MNYAFMLGEIKLYAGQLYAERQVPAHTYHNLEHTIQVVSHCSQMAAHYELDQHRSFVLLTAAWFQHTGHLFGFLNSQVEASVEIMVTYFNTTLTYVEQELIHEIATCILATRLIEEPADLLAKMICDANNWHLGTDLFLAKEARLFAEMKLQNGQQMGSYRQAMLRVLENHRFFTRFCQVKLETGLRLNKLHLKGSWRNTA